MDERFRKVERLLMELSRHTGLNDYDIGNYFHDTSGGKIVDMWLLNPPVV